MDNYFDPAMTLGADDPLRAWAAENLDPETGKLIIADPSKAIEQMIAKGVPPPPDAPPMAYTDGYGEGVTGARPPTYPGEVIGGARPPQPRAPTAQEIGAASAGVESTGFPIFDQNGRMLGNQTSAQGQVPRPPVVPQVAAPVVAPPAASPLDPLEPEVNPSAGQPLIPRPRPAEAPSSEVGAKKKGDLEGGLNDFAKSFAGVKALQPPPVNPVGTPAVRGHSAINAPNVNQLLQLIGQQQASPVLSTLGRLLVAGKA